MPLEPDAAQRRALLELLRRELSAAHARVLAEGAPPQEISSLLDERIRRLGGGRSAGAREPEDAREPDGPAGVTEVPGVPGVAGEPGISGFADAAGAPGQTAPGRSGHRQRGDDVEDRGDDPIDLGGVVQ